MTRARLASLARHQLWIVLTVGYALNCAPADAADATIGLVGQTMGTVYTVSYVPVSGRGPDRAAVGGGIDALLERVSVEMSTYRKDSEISRFNASRETERPFSISQGFAAVVGEAIRLHAQTQGALDVTVAPLVDLWGFGAGSVGVSHRPSDAEITAAMERVGIDKLVLHDTKLQKRVPDLKLDLGAIAKGFGVDEVGRYLESLGITNYIVEIGGEVRARGSKGDRPWQVGVAEPRDDQSVRARVALPLKNMSAATSGTYRNYFDEDGIRYSHLIDPRSGRPVSNNLVSLTVLAENCSTADGLSTGLFVLGPDEAMRLADAQNLPVLMLVRGVTGVEERRSKALLRLLVD